MVIIWGERLYGKVDAVPGLGHVATKFFHLWYIPLIPMGGWFVTHEDFDGWRGAEIGISGKSFFVAWLRVALFLGMFAGLFLALDHTAFAGTAASITSFVLLLASYKVPFLAQASHARAKELAHTCGIGDGGQISLDLAYGAIDEEEAYARLATLEREHAAAVAAAERDEAEREQRRRDERAKRKQRRLEERVAASDVPVAELLVTRTPGALKFACPSCNTATKVPANLAGKKGKCPKCKAALRVPARPRRARVAA